MGGPKPRKVGVTVPPSPSPAPAAAAAAATATATAIVPNFYARPSPLGSDLPPNPGGRRESTGAAEGNEEGVWVDAEYFGFGT